MRNIHTYTPSPPEKSLPCQPDTGNWPPQSSTADPRSLHPETAPVQYPPDRQEGQDPRFRKYFPLQCRKSRRYPEPPRIPSRMFPESESRWFPLPPPEEPESHLQESGPRRLTQSC